MKALLFAHTALRNLANGGSATDSSSAQGYGGRKLGFAGQQQVSSIENITMLLIEISHIEKRQNNCRILPIKII
jgi:hypothetical protein